MKDRPLVRGRPSGVSELTDGSRRLKIALKSFDFKFSTESTKIGRYSAEFLRCIYLKFSILPSWFHSAAAPLTLDAGGRNRGAFSRLSGVRTLGVVKPYQISCSARTSETNIMVQRHGSKA